MKLLTLFWDEPKTHLPLPKVLGFFSLLSAPKFFPPTYLPPPSYLTSFCTHYIVRVQESLKQEKRRGRTKLVARSGRAKVAIMTKRWKWQIGSLKVSSLPFLRFFCWFFFLFEKKKMTTQKQYVIVFFYGVGATKKVMEVSCQHLLYV
jgi:hypothetical protein